MLAEACSATCARAGVRPALAQTSAKPIQIIVPFAPGASADGAARIVANDLGPRLGVRSWSRTRPAAGGVLGLPAGRESTPDGDTLGVGATGRSSQSQSAQQSRNPTAARARPRGQAGSMLPSSWWPSGDPVRRPFAKSSSAPRPRPEGSPMLDRNRHQPAPLRRAVKQATGANLVHVPYRGSARRWSISWPGRFRWRRRPHVRLSAYPVPAAWIALGPCGQQALSVTPEIPHRRRAGSRLRAPSGFIGLFAPAGTPGPVVKKLSQEVAAILPRGARHRRALTSGHGLRGRRDLRALPHRRVRKKMESRRCRR